LRGFTLLELLITVVIVGILAAIALPSYSQYVIRANRTQAKQFMADIANRQEQYLLDQRSYAGTVGSGGLGMTAPSETAGLYTFAAAVGGNDCLGAALPTPGYTITATAIGGQATDGDLCLDSVNNKTPGGKWGK
jgi:type IV pilus assembly protein PilE